MKKTNKVVLIIVLLLVLLFGVGQFFAFSNQSSVSPNSSSHSSSSTTTTQPATQVVAYVPGTIASSPSVEKGLCWTNSIAAPFRTDAWRCAVGNGISDPCFQISNSTGTLLCNVNPTMPNSTSTFVLKLTQPLPTPEALQTIPPFNWAWLVELSDGTLCTPFTGTLPFTASGESANYGCAPGPLGDNLLIFGDLNASSNVWTANIGTLSQATSSLPTITSSSTVSVEAVWQ